ncbi:protein kinase [bacterium]|nr:protein kinase [bacterium]
MNSQNGLTAPLNLLEQQPDGELRVPEHDRDPVNDQKAEMYAPAEAGTTPTLDESSPAAANLKTRRIGHFEILRTLGQGAFGAVYLARDPVLEREVAIKVPHASRIATPEMRQRFLREARAAAGLRHPHICPVYEVGEENDTPYIVMAFIKGQELSAALKRRGHLSDRVAAVMVRRLALALEFAHQQGIVHRDLKPENIMIDQERKEPVIMDFGLAQRESQDESRMTQEGQLMGTPVYMPPEQARGDLSQIGPASDVYTLGVILYELLCGRRPHEGSMAEVLSKVLTVDAAPPSTIRDGIAPQLEAICMKAISREIGQRYASMAEFAAELTEFLKASSDTSTTAETTPGSAAPDDPGGRSAAIPVTPDASSTVPTVLVSRRRTWRPRFGQRRIVRLASVAVALILLVAFVSASRKDRGNDVDSDASLASGRNSQQSHQLEAIPAGNSAAVKLSADDWVSSRLTQGERVADTSAWLTNDDVIRCDSSLDSLLLSPLPYANFEWNLEIQVPDEKLLFVGVRTDIDSRQFVVIPVLTRGTRDMLDAVMRPQWEKDRTLSLMEASAEATRPAPAWNTLRIRCVADRVTATLNSVPLDAQIATAPIFRKPPKFGQIGFLSQGGLARDVLVRNMTISILD